jgi:ketosteroid isomerase-like protein
MDEEHANLSESDILLPEQVSPSDSENQQNMKGSPSTSKRLIVALLGIGTLCVLAVAAGRKQQDQAAATPGEIVSLDSVQSSWGNHFASFGAGNLVNIVKDYTDKSTIEYFEYDPDTKSGKTVEYKGSTGAKTFFTGLFKTLKDRSGMKAPVIEVEKWEAGGMVLLVWLCPTSGLPLVTDTFIFDKDSKILQQKVVNFKGVKGAVTSASFTKTSGSPCSGRRLADSATKSFETHMGNFKAKDTAKIALDYSEEAVIRFYDFKAKKLQKFTGKDEITKFFTGMFKALSDTSGMKTPEIKVKQWPDGGGMAFLVFSCETSGLPLVTATFIFDKAFNIYRQTVVSWPAA